MFLLRYLPGSFTLLSKIDYFELKDSILSTSFFKIAFLFFLPLYS
jgi:hypothetical protein